MQIIPTAIHGLLDLVLAATLIVLPWLAGWDHELPEASTCLTLGLVMMGYSVLTFYEWGVLHVISTPTHLVLDLAVGAVLAMSPWIMGFAERVYIPHMLFGVTMVFAAIVCEWRPRGALGAGPRRHEALIDLFRSENE